MKKNDSFKNKSRERIIELIEEFCGSNVDRKQQSFADMCGVSKYSISQYVNGTNAPGNITAAKIANKCNVDPLWVMGFDVPKRKKFTATFSQTDLANSIAKMGGDADEKNQQEKYYIDPETARYAEDMATNPKLKALYEVQRDMDADDLMALYGIALALKRKSERLDSDDPA